MQLLQLYIIILSYLSHFGSISFVDDLTGDKKMWVCLICRWKPNTTGVGTVESGNAQGIDKLTFINPIPRPTSGFEESIPILGKKESFEKQNHLPAVFSIEEIKDFSAMQ